MLSIQEFFDRCAGLWNTERTYHMPLQGEVERSHTEFRVTALTTEVKERMLQLPVDVPMVPDLVAIASNPTAIPGFAIAFDTVSEKGEKVSMSLQALFVPDAFVLSAPTAEMFLAPPGAAEVPAAAEIVRGYYLRDEGYSESGAIAGRFTYQPSRQILEMTTYYRRSVAVDQMRFIAPDLRMRTIVTYRRDADPAQPPTEITLVGFGLERRSSSL